MIPPSSHALYEGFVTHRRTALVEHAFRYPICLVYLDLDQLDDAFRGRWLWSCQRPAVAWFRRQDHLGDPRLKLADAARQLLTEHGVCADGPIRLLTQPRYFGFAMNPVSFYYCYGTCGDGRGEQLRAVIAEVHNTPWGERHCYVLPVEAGSPGEAWLPKRFHVSPFMPLDLSYRWQLTPPGESLAVRIENHDEEQHFFTASLQLTRRAWTPANLRRVLWRYPLMTHRVFAGIYWQALWLWWKGAPYFPHPGSSDSTLREESSACGTPG